MKKTATDVTLLGPDGKEELGVIPGWALEVFMVKEGIRGRSIKTIKKAALLLFGSILVEAKKLVGEKKVRKSTKTKKGNKKS